MGSVTRVDDGGLYPSRVRETVSCARGEVPHDNDVGAHCLDRLGRILQAFALGNTRALDLERHHIRRKPLGCRFEGQTCSGRVFKEQVDHRHTAQRGELRDRAVSHVRELMCHIEQAHRVIPGQVLRTQEVLHDTTCTSSTPSVSRSRTVIRSPSADGRFLPT